MALLKTAPFRIAEVFDTSHPVQNGISCAPESLMLPGQHPPRASSRAREFDQAELAEHLEVILYRPLVRISLEVRSNGAKGRSSNIREYL